jgi:hypothetical protein
MIDIWRRKSDEKTTWPSKILSLPYHNLTTLYLNPSLSHLSSLLSLVDIDRSKMQQRNRRKEQGLNAAGL